MAVDVVAVAAVEPFEEVSPFTRETPLYRG